MTEDQFQAETAKLLHRTLGWLAWHTPNERGKRLVRHGVLPGVSDWFIAEQWEDGGRSGFGVAIELKVDDGVLSAEQKRFLEQASSRGCLTAVCRTYDEFYEVISKVRPANGRRFA